MSRHDLAPAYDSADAGFAVHSKGIVYIITHRRDVIIPTVSMRACADLSRYLTDSMPNNVSAADTALPRPDEDAERVLVKTVHTR